MRNGWDDDNLQAALREAMWTRSDVPSGVVEAARNAYSWRTIDAELAELTFDSSREPYAAATRSESASIRALTFTSAHLTIELEVTENALIGQVMPPRAGTLEARTAEGGSVTAEVDGIGCFSIEPIPPSAFRLRYRNHEGSDVVTGWITL
jgi:hypothetical protein